MSLLWSVCKLDSLFESAASFRISSLASPLLLSLSLPLSPELAHGVLRPRTPPLMGLYSNFGLWFSPGFPLARETSQGNGGSKRVRAGLEEGQRFPTLQQPPTRMEIAFRLIPTERSNPPSPLATRSTFSYPSLPPTLFPSQAAEAGQGRGMPDFNIREIKITLLYLHRVMGKRTILARWRSGVEKGGVFELKEIDIDIHLSRNFF